MQEAWEWQVNDYILAFNSIKRLSPNHYRKGKCLYKRDELANKGPNFPNQLEKTE